MWRLSIFRQKRPGFALVFTVLIALAMVIPVMILASSAITRRKNVSGEAMSDRVLTVADSTVDMVLNKVNEFVKEMDTDPTIKSGLDAINEYYKDNYYSSGNVPDPPYEPNRVAVKYTVAYLLSKINGGVPYQPDGTSDPAAGVGADYDSYKDASFTEGDGSLWDIEDNIASYLYDMKTQNYFVVTTDASGKVPAYSGEVGFNYVKNLQTGEVKSLSAWDSRYEKDNRWIESDVNVEYVDDGQNKPHSAKFEIRVTSYPISSSEEFAHLQRSVLAEASLDTLEVNTSSSGGSGSSGSSGSNNVPAAFKHAVWSGGDTIVNGNITFEAANIQSDGSYQVLSEGGDLYGAQDITLNGSVKVNGNVITGENKGEGLFGDPVITNGAVKIKKGIVYGEKEDLPDFPTDTENNVKKQSQKHSGTASNGINANGNYSLTVNGLNTPYYINGDAYLNGWGDVHFVTTNSDPPVDWYVNGDLVFNGDTDIYVNKPGYIWVNGDITFNGRVRIHGSVTFVSNGQVVFNGDGKIKYDNDKDMVAVISEGEGFDGGIIVNGFGEYDGIFYAPHSNIIFNGSTTLFGTAVGGGWDLGGSWKQGVIMNGFSKFIFDTRLAGYNPGGGGTPPTPPLPGSASTPTITGVQFSVKTLYRLMWREIISNPVNTTNIRDICTNEVEYKFTTSAS